jgi:hypothetical protein
MPQRARAAGQRFEKGHPKKGGRRKGTRNLLSRRFKRAVLEAATLAGSDGHGTGGLDGYISRLARFHPEYFANLLYGALAVETRETATRATKPAVPVSARRKTK